MNKRKLFGRALGALAMIAAAGLLITHPLTMASVLMFLGGSTVVYQSFQTGGDYGGGYTGGATAPTQAQSATVNAVVATVQFSDTDTVATITHNFGLSAAQAAALRPFLTYYFQLMAAAANTYPMLTFALTNTNVITVNKISNTGTGGTTVVTVLKPSSFVAS